jgi:hypothetical protein
MGMVEYSSEGREKPVRGIVWYHDDRFLGRVYLQDGGSTFKYEVKVLFDDRQIGSDYCFTLWGARLVANKIRRRHRRRFKIRDLEARHA